MIKYNKKILNKLFKLFVLGILFSIIYFTYIITSSIQAEEWVETFIVILSGIPFFSFIGMMVWSEIEEKLNSLENNN